MRGSHTCTQRSAGRAGCNSRLCPHQPHVVRCVWCRPVTVYRLLIRDSIEHRVLARQEEKHAL